jgi:hypothetical protein
MVQLSARAKDAKRTLEDAKEVEGIEGEQKRKSDL